MARDYASDVYECLIRYQTAAMKDISKRYSHDKAQTLKVLAGYPGKQKYHGHLSGAPGDGVAAGAEANQKAALQYLRVNAPAKPPPKIERKKGADPGKKKASVSHTQKGLTILKENSGNLGTATKKLQEWDADWRENRSVSQEYDRLLKAKKEKKEKHGA